MNNINLSNNVVSHIKDNDNEYLQFKRLEEYKDILAHAYSVGIDKNYRTFKANREALEIRDYEKNVNNYKELCKAIKLNSDNLIKANQAHTDNILCVDKFEKNEKIDTIEKSDGLITNTKGIVLATTNADCILLLFFDPVKKVIANVHSGWKGTLQRISEKTVGKMVENYGCKPKDIIVCICPSIRKCHFEVGKDVKELFFNEFKNLENINEFIINKENKWFIDTVLINKLILKKMGILEENIEDSNICSVCNKDMIHSYRAEGESYGLATAVIGLV